jgi:hypothetical protein
MSNYARPRISIVIDEDVMQAAKQFAEEEQRPVSTYLALLVSEVIRAKVAEREKEKKLVTSNHKT